MFVMQDEALSNQQPGDTPALPSTDQLTGSCTERISKLLSNITSNNFALSFFNCKSVVFSPKKHNSFHFRDAAHNMGLKIYIRKGLDKFGLGFP